MDPTASYRLCLAHHVFCRAPFMLLMAHFSTPLFLAAAEESHNTKENRKRFFPHTHACTQGGFHSVSTNQNYMKENPTRSLDGTLKPG